MCRSAKSARSKACRSAYGVGLVKTYFYSIHTLRTVRVGVSSTTAASWFERMIVEAGEAMKERAKAIRKEKQFKILCQELFGHL